MEAFVLSSVLIFGDWVQTREIARHPVAYETNIFLGSKPSLNQVNLWFGGVMVANGVIGFSLPKKYQKAWFSTIAVMELGFNVNNHQIGIKYRW